MSATPRIPVPDGPRTPQGKIDLSLMYTPEVGQLSKRLIALCGVHDPTDRELELDLVLAELVRLLNARTQQCVY